MRISDWSSDVCSSDLGDRGHVVGRQPVDDGAVGPTRAGHLRPLCLGPERFTAAPDCAVAAYSFGEAVRPRTYRLLSRVPPLAVLLPESFRGGRSEGRRVGKEGVSAFRARWSP